MYFCYDLKEIILVHLSKRWFFEWFDWLFVGSLFNYPLYLQDKSVAFKIFELGLKKFSGSAEFILAYLGIY